MSTIVLLPQTDPDTPATGKVRVWIGTDKILRSKDSTGTVTIYSAASTEDIQDIVGAMIADTSTINVTYTDSTGALTLDVITSAIDHNSTLNYDTNKHIDHTAITFTAGTGLTGGGTLTSNRTFAIGDVGIAGVYGDASHYPIVTTNAQGQVTAVTPQSFPTTSYLMPNLLINSNLNISQRGTFTTSAAAANLSYYPDRLYVLLTTCTADRIINTTNQPTGMYDTKSFRLTATNTATGTFAIGQAVELPTYLIGKEVTFSWYVKSNNANARLRLVWGAGGVLDAQSTAHTGGGAWERLSMTVVIPANVSLTEHLYCKVSIYNAGNVSVASGSYIEVTAGMLTEGALIAYRPAGSLAQEVTFCQRYRESNYPLGTTPANGTFYLGAASCVAIGTVFYSQIAYKTAKRIAITAGNIAYYRSSAGSTDGTWLVFVLTGQFLDITPSISGTNTNEYGILLTGTHNVNYPSLALGGWVVDCELTPA